MAGDYFSWRTLNMLAAECNYKQGRNKQQETLMKRLTEVILFLVDH